MNRIYKVIWSKARNCYVVVSEIAKTHSKGGTGVSGVVKKVGSSALLTAAVTAMLMTPLGTAFADPAKAEYNPSTNSVAAGANSVTATGDNSTAVGVGTTTATGTSSVAVGDDAKANGDGSVAIGDSSRALENNTVAIGNGARAENASDTAVGEGARAKNGEASAYGHNAHADGGESVALGNMSASSGEQSVAVGNQANSSGSEAVAIGDLSEATGGDSVAVGEEAHAHGGDSTAVGADSKALTGSDAAFGHGALADGKGTDTEEGEATAVGNNSSAQNTRASAFGASADAMAEDSTALGSNALAEGERSVALGGADGQEEAAHASGKYSSAIGTGTEATGVSSTAVGGGPQNNGAQALEDGAIAIGGGGEDTLGANASGVNSTAVGVNTSASGVQAVAIGSGAKNDPGASAAADKSIVIGANATSAEAAENGVAIGTGSSVTVENGVALGAGSIANVGAAEEPGFIPNPKSYITYDDNPIWQSNEAAVSIGNPDGSVTRQITGVAAGTNDWDAANVAQLKAAMTHYYSVDTTKDTDEAGNNNYDNDGAQSSGKDAIAAGVNAKATAANASAFGSNVTASGINATAIGTAGTTAGDYSTAVGNSGVSASGYSAAMGYGGVTASGNSTAIGNSTVSASGYSAAIGYGSIYASGYSTAIGTNSVSASGSNSIALGSNGVGASGSGSAALGSNGIGANGSNSTVIGHNSVYTSSSAEGSTAIGSNTVNANGSRSTAIGSQGITANGQYSTAIGNSTVVSNGYESTAIGAGSVYANGSYSTAIGYGNVTADGTYSTAVGNSGTYAGAYQSTAIGYDSDVDGGSSGSMAAGHKAKVSGASGGTAVGVNAEVYSNGATAVGSNAKVNGGSYGSAAFGTSTDISGSSGSTAIGSGSHISGGSGATVLGANATTSNSSGAIAMGNDAHITNSYGAILLAEYSSSISSSNGSTAIGNRVRISSGSGSNVFGNDSSIDSDGGSMVLGNSSNITSGYGSHLLGNQSSVNGSSGSTVVGNNSSVTGGSNGSQVFGNDASVYGGSDGAMAIGNRSHVYGGSSGSFALGGDSKVYGGSNGASAVGVNSEVSNGSGGSQAVGNSAKVTNGSGGASAVGSGALVDGSGGSDAFGNNAKVIGGGGSTAVGNAAQVTGSGGATAVGTGAVVAGSDNGLAMGARAVATGGWAATAIGTDATASISQGVALGSNALADIESGKTGYNPLWKSQPLTPEEIDSSTWTSTAAAVSVGGKTFTYAKKDADGNYVRPDGTITDDPNEAEQITKTYTRQIANVAAGTEDTDAVNVAQLKKVVAEAAGSGDHYFGADDANNVELETAGPVSENKITRIHNQQVNVIGDSDYAATEVTARVSDGVTYTEKEGQWVDKDGNVLPEDAEYTEKQIKQAELVKEGNIKTSIREDKFGIQSVKVELNRDLEVDSIMVTGKDGKEGEPGTPGTIGINGRDGTNGLPGEDGETTTRVDIQVGPSGEPGLDGKDGVTRIIYKDGDGDHEVATLDDGLKFGANAGEPVATEEGEEEGPNPVPNKLNSTVNIVGSAAVEGREYSSENLTTTVGQAEDGTTTITVKMDKDPNFDTLIVNGKDGKDGEPGTPGKIGIRGEPGEDGTPGEVAYISVTNDGTPGVDGKDGEDGITRIVYTDPKDPDKPIEVATLDDGMKYSGDFGNTKDNPVAVKLNKNVDVVGNATAKSADDLTDGNIGVVAEPEIDEETGEATGNAKLTIKLNKDINLGTDGSLTVGGEVDEEGNPKTDEYGNPTSIKIGPQTVNHVDGSTEEGDFIVGLDNTNWDPTNIVSGRAATEDQLAAAQTHYYSVNDNGTRQDNWLNDGATGINSLAAGTNAKASGITSTAVGHNANASVMGAVALGSNSVADRPAATESGYDVTTGTNYDRDDKDSATWKATTGALSLGGTQEIKTKVEPGTPGAVEIDGEYYLVQTVETTRQITGVAAGLEDTDAVNVAQLKRLENAMQIHDYSVNSVEPGKDLNYDNKGATGDNAMAAGVNAIAEAENATAVGNMAIARNKNSTAVGNMALASADSAAAFGDNAQATIKDSVAIGSNALTTEVVGTENITVAGTTYDFAGTKPVGTVSVGQKDQERTITHVAAGRISETSTDAINGSQLYAMAKAIDEVDSRHTTVSVGGVATTADDTPVTDPDGNLTLERSKNENGAYNYDLKLARDLDVDTIVVNGKDGAPGEPGLTIKGQDGAPGAIGIAGEDGEIKTITITENGEPGVDGKDGITRIIIDDKPVATLDDGMKYAGDFGDGAAVKLNKTVNVVGEAASEDDLTTGNIGVVADQDGEDGKLTIKLNKDIDLGEEGSITMGDVHIHDGDEISFGGNVIHNVAPGVEDDDVVNVSQLKEYSASARTEVTVNEGTAAPDDQGTYTTDGGNLQLRLTKAQDGHDVFDVKLSDDINIGGPGKDGKDGVDGHIGVDGKDGKSGVGIDGKDGITVYGKDGKDGEPAVAINGKDGVGHIGLTGPAGKDGKDAKADITVQEGPVGVDGTDGADGKDGMDRIVYEDHNHVTHEVATLDDGMKYSGDFSHTKDDPVPVRLNNIVDIVGESTAASADELSDGNIGVVAEQDGEGAKLVVKLNKNIDLSEEGSITMGDTVINNEGMTINNAGPEGDSTIVINGDNVSFGGNVIHNVAPGVEDTDVVNVSQLKEYSSSARTEVTVNEGVAAPDDQGTYTTDGGNLQLRLTKAQDGHDVFDVKLSDDINIGGPGKDGKDGVDGHIGVDGKDGKSGVGIDGKDGITVYGKDGKDGEPAVAINGKDGVGHIGLAGPAGKDGKDGVSDIHMIWGEPIVGKDGAPGTDGITRIEYTDPEGNPHQVATTDDGLYFGANTGDPNPAPNRINSRVNIMGAGTKDDDSYSGENLKTIISQTGEGKDAVTTINVVMDRDLNVDNIAVNGKDGKDGAPGTAGHIGVDGKDGKAGVGIDGKDGITVTGKDGKDGVTIYGKDGENGTEGHIGLTGQPGKDGKDAKADITVKEGPVGVDGTDGADGKDGMDRIVYEDHNGTEHEVATLDDGMKYSGDFGNTKDDPVPVKLNNNVDIVGNSTAASEDELSDGNIGVVAKPTEDGGAQLVVKLNKNIDLTEEGSVTMGDTVINNEGLTINNGGPEGDIVINKGDVSFGGNVIHNVAPGVEDNDVVNVSQLKEVEQLASQHSTVTVDGSPIDENVTDGNLLLTVTKEEGKGTNYDLKLNDNIELGGPGKDGKDGKDGSIGVNGADGKSGVGIDGKDGISVRGTDGKDGVTIYAKNGEDGTDGSEGHIGLAGKNGKDGKDGVTDIYTKWGDPTPGTYGKDGKDGTDGITRIVYTDPEGDEHQVATMDDGLKFGANSGDPNPAVNKLSSTVEIKGAGTKDDDSYTGKNLKTIISQEGEGKDAVTTINVVMDKDLETETLVVNGKDGKDGEPGTPGRIGIDGKDGEAGIGIDGKDGITITGKDGKDGVSIRGVDGKDGTEGHIGLAGRDGKDADIFVGKGDPGVDGKDGITRIIYQDPSGEEPEIQVATLEDGMKYGGDFGDGAAVKLNKTVNVVGEAKNEADLTTGNIGVVAAQDGDNGKLTVKLNKDIDLGDKGSVKMGDTTINNDGLTINEGPSVTKNGIDAGSKKITNVAPGEADTDAVNVSQLKDFAGDVNKNIGDVNNRINRLGDRVDKVGAGAAALAGLHPLDFDPDAKWDVAAGYGHYRGENAVAVGAFYRPSEDVMVNVASTVGNGDNMISAGVSVKVGGNTHVSNSRVALSKQVLEMRKEIEDMRSLMADSAFGKQLDLSKLQLFPDTPENHWAYDYVATLAGNGLLEGYPDGNFKGDRALTRYEVAAILYRAMMNGAQLTQRALEEFAPELDRIRVDTLTRHSDGTPSIQRVRIIKDRR